MPGVARGGPRNQDRDVRGLLADSRGSLPDRSPTIGPQLGLSAGPVLIGYVGQLLVAQTNINFPAIPQSYRHLLLQWMARTTSGGTGDVIWMQFNGDTGNNYDTAGLEGMGGAASAFDSPGLPALRIGVAPGGAAGGGLYNTGEYTVTRYIDRTGSSFRTGHGYQWRQDSARGLSVVGGRWAQAAPIQSIHIWPDGGSFAVGSEFSLYGIP